MVSKDDKPVKGDSVSDLQPLQDLYALMVSEGLDTIEVKEDDLRIKLSRRPSGVMVHSFNPATPQKSEAPVSAVDSEAESETSSNQPAIQAPLAGVFYRASSPTTPPFIKEGDVAEVGQTLCIVEAMKVMNEIKAETRCRIVRIVAENSRPVTAGQNLFLTEPA
jgi:acetyl-CoA carboxylase biotin carboxyl carrier protein